MTSATDELRRLLDERGVEYETYVEQPTGFEHVKWNFNEHGSADFNLEFGEPWLTMYGVISGPEQAIAATLGDTDATAVRQGGAGTCHITDNGPWGYPYVCSACGASFDPDVNGGDYNFCPNCGRRIEVDE